MAYRIVERSSRYFVQCQYGEWKIMYWADMRKEPFKSVEAAEKYIEQKIAADREKENPTVVKVYNK